MKVEGSNVRSIHEHSFHEGVGERAEFDIAKIARERERRLEAQKP